MKKPTFLEFSRFLSNAGFRWHSTGTLLKNNSKYGEYLEGDSLPEEIRLKILAKFGDWVRFKQTGAEFAPETRRPAVILLSAKAHAEKRYEAARSDSNMRRGRGLRVF